MYGGMQKRFAYRPCGRHWRRLRRVGVLAGAAAFLLQMLTWSVYAPAMAMGGETVMICTMEGMTEITLGPDGQPVSPDKAKADSKHCGFCLLASGLATPSLPAALSPPVQLARHGAEALPGGLIAAGWFLSTLQARGPPTVG